MTYVHSIFISGNRNIRPKNIQIGWLVFSKKSFKKLKKYAFLTNIPSKIVNFNILHIFQFQVSLDCSVLLLITIWG